MYIKDKEYYHLHNKKICNELWVVGNILNFSNKNINYFNGYYEKYSPKILVNGVEHLPRNALEIILRNNLHIKDIQYSDYLFKSLKSIITDLGLYIREEIFEEVRVKYFPGLPSRKTCIWVFEKQAINYWRQTFDEDFELYKLELTGIIHKADQRHLSSDIISHQEWRIKAFNYWTGVDDKNPVEEELLFEGIAKIKEKY